MQRQSKTLRWFGLILAAGALAGCRTYDLQPDTLTQVSTINALLAGDYDGQATFKTLESHGNFGLGTVDRLDGEMLGFDGRFYQIRADGTVQVISPTQTTPFATVKFFKPDRFFRLTGPLDQAALDAQLDARLPTPNWFYAIRIDGAFNRIQVRSVPAQSKPYPPLEVAARQQKVRELRDVYGTLVGIRCPVFAGGVNVPGYHWHFITIDRQAGGHVLSLESEGELLVSIDPTTDWEVQLPGSDTFQKLDLKPDRSAALHRVEK
jgi:acetolactate decarboxylase